MCRAKDIVFEPFWSALGYRCVPFWSEIGLGLCILLWNWVCAFWLISALLKYFRKPKQFLGRSETFWNILLWNILVKKWAIHPNPNFRGRPWALLCKWSETSLVLRAFSSFEMEDRKNPWSGCWNTPRTVEYVVTWHMMKWFFRKLFPTSAAGGPVCSLQSETV